MALIDVPSLSAEEIENLLAGFEERILKEYSGIEEAEVIRCMDCIHAVVADLLAAENDDDESFPGCSEYNVARIVGMLRAMLLRKIPMLLRQRRVEALCNPTHRAIVN